MVAGHLREKNGYWHMVITYRDEMGNRKERSFTTHLKAKGNRRRAEEMLFEKRRQITADLDMRRNAKLHLRGQNPPMGASGMGFLEKELKIKSLSISSVVA